MEASRGQINAVADGVQFEKQLNEWFAQQSNIDIVPLCLRMRAIVLDIAKREGIVEAKDLPADLQFTFSEISLTLAAKLIDHVNARIAKELGRLCAAQRIVFYDQVIEDLTQAETYALDALPPERAGILKAARSLRAECHRACQALRRHQRR
jgi:hypothetical protein